MSTQNQSSSNNKSLIVLIVLLILCGVIMIVMQTNNSNTKKELRANIDSLTVSQEKLMLEYNVALKQIEQLEMMNDSLKKRIGYDNQLIASLKRKITALLNGEELPGGEKAAPNKKLVEAQNLINQLNAKIAEYLAEIAQLRAANEGLVKEKTVLTTENKDLKIRVDTLRETNLILEKKVDMASILVVGDVNLVGVKVDGGEEKENNKVNKMTLLRAKFNVLANRVINSGFYDFYVTIVDPNGNLLVDPNSKAPAKITLADGSEVQVTEKISTEISQGQNRFIKYDYKSASKFPVGVYTITIYQRGYKVGQGSGEFKKGFLGIF